MDKYPNVLWAGRFPDRANGSALNFGRFLLGTAAGYAIYVNKSIPLSDVSNTEPEFYDNASTLTFSYTYDPDSVYYIGITEVNACGGLESENPVWVGIKTDSSGNILGVLIGNVTWAEVIKKESGTIKVRWRYDSTSASPTGFKLYAGIDRSNITSLKATEAYIRGKELYSAEFDPGVDNGWLSIYAYSTGMTSEQPYILRIGTDDQAGIEDSYAKLITN